MTVVDAKHALAILNRASENQMYDAERIPEDDIAKIQAATEQVQLAEQLEATVRRACPGETDDRVIAQKFPHWTAAMSVIAEAKVFMGSGESSTPATEEPLSQVRAEEDLGTTKHEQAGDSGYAPPTVDEQVAADQLGMSIVSQGFLDEGLPRLAMPSTEKVDLPTANNNEEPSSIDDAPSQSVDQAQDQGDPVNGEVWLDQLGNAWKVISYSGGTSAEVESVKSGEPTIVPAGFLKKRQIVAIEDDVVSNPEVDAETVVDVVVYSPHQIIDYLKREQSDSSTAVVAPMEDFDSMTSPKTPEQSQTDDRVASDHGLASGSSQSEYEVLVEEVQDRYEPAWLPVPAEPSDPPSIDAESFADVDDATARVLHAKYNALAARAKYLHDVEDAISRRCEFVRMHYVRRAMAVARRSVGKDATVTEVKILADDDPIVIEWTEYVRRHADEARAYKTFHDIYAQHVVVLSRDWSMREMQVR